ncbi:MAG: adenylosuccinate lyase, partial [Planctomycetia bacterium]|nr:adenylosuccinate lyase [Planctomycetia bacterium]
DFYENPLIGRYASREMSALWSPQKKHSTWRRLWVALAEAEAELGLAITPEQISEMRAHVDDIDFRVAAEYERKLRHDVMAHVHTYGECCPHARPIIHLGATSCYVTDNTDLILLRDALKMVRDRLVSVIHRLADFAVAHRDRPCLAFTHLQPAQPTTLGKRACLWAGDFVLDLTELEHRLDTMKAHGSRGTTGTQASFLELFGGSHEMVRRLDQIICGKIGFRDSYPVTGQTYPRKIDSMILAVLSGIAQSASKFATDLRILQHRREVEEPFEKSQIGSSAMAYKRNPMRSERICSLARYVIQQEGGAAMTAATQWFERTLDDSAARRLYLPQSFLGIDAVLILCQNVTDGLVVYPKVIAKNLESELPFMATENILMDAVRQGGDRQELHERIRVHSQAAAAQVKQEGAPNDLMERLAGDPAFRGIDLSGTLDASKYIGRAPQQVDEFVQEIVEPIRRKYAESLELTGEVRV